ncbi:MAG TPA: CHASE3 domain-containing protein [Streptosporangiaceae bacterium]|jgi:signal transduction histidine kinase|nr:CHASE3 domain-containing protein [Streptosporangiaceae bacterium]
MTAPRDDGRRRGWPVLTVQGWFRVVFMVLAVLVVAAALTIVQLVGHEQQVSSDLENSVLPAQAQAYRLQGALVDQETGVRGFGITGRPDFLQPYTAGLATESAAAAQIKRLADGSKQLSADLTGVEQAADAWRHSYALPLIALARHGPLGGQDLSLLDASKTSFNHLRALFIVQNTHLAAMAAHDRATQGSSRDENDLAFIVILVAFLLAAAALTVVLHRAVVRPLNRLRTGSRHVVDGDFSRPIEPSGPADLRAVAGDVEAMRSELVRGLQDARAAQEVAARQAAELDAQAAELMRSNAELEQFAYVASHDLQEPLRKVASFCQLLERRYGDQLDERGHQYIYFAVDGAKRLQVLINDLLTFSRVGRGQTAHAELALDQPLEAAITGLDSAIEESGAVIGRPTSLPTVAGDATLLTMLWQNLIGNGIKFRASERTPVVQITVAERPGGDGAAAMWEFCVQDNGIGIPAEFGEKVFVIFQRLHARDAYPGTGIGLALCKRIVEYHGGEISLDPACAEGTRICFTLPQLAADEPDQTGESSAASRPSVESTEGIPA